jgi:hypothetical protein
MDKLRVTAFGLRLLGVALLVWTFHDSVHWLSNLLHRLFSPRGGSGAYMTEMLQAWSIWWLCLVAAGVVLTAKPATGARLLWRGLNSGDCPRCGYDRGGLAADSKCPECGTVPTTAPR